jgi:hypothetical protein
MPNSNRYRSSNLESWLIYGQCRFLWTMPIMIKGLRAERISYCYANSMYWRNQFKVPILLLIRNYILVAFLYVTANSIGPICNWQYTLRRADYSNTVVHMYLARSKFCRDPDSCNTLQIGFSEILLPRFVCFHRWYPGHPDKIMCKS